GRGEILFGDPAGLEAGLHDHLLGLFAADREVLEGAVEALDLAIPALGPAHEIVGGAAGEILDRLDVVLAERNEHGGVEAFDLVELVLDAERAAFLVVGRLDGVEVVDSTLLDSTGDLVVEALDRGDLGNIDIGELLNGRETFGGEELGHRLVDIEGVHEERRTLRELLLATLRLFLLGENVDVPADQLRREAH